MSVWRQQLRPSYERWRLIHLVLTAAVLVAPFAHAVCVDAYTSLPVVSRRRRAPGRGDAVTLELAADGHPGLRCAAGQFARIRDSQCL
jgi:hypothetical protein